MQLTNSKRVLRKKSIYKGILKRSPHESNLFWKYSYKEHSWRCTGLRYVYLAMKMEVLGLKNVNFKH